MEIVDGIEMLGLPMNFKGVESTIYTLIYDDENVIRVDAGIKNSAPIVNYPSLWEGFIEV